jgi:chromosome partitioning protein
MKVMAVANQKGGCGKTVTAVNLSAALSRKGYKVLLIDFDPQAHATFSLKRESSFSITDILENPSSSENVHLENFTTISDNFFFIPSSIGLASFEHKNISQNDKLKVLSSFLKKIESNFDYCIIDCPPNLGILTLNALEASQHTLIPLSICDFSLKGIDILKNILLMLKEFKGYSPAPFYLLSQLDLRSRFSKEFINRAKNLLGNFLLDTKIRTNVYLREAIANGSNIFEYKSDSRGAQDFMSLADEISKLMSKTAWTSLFLKATEFEEIHVVGDFNKWQKNDKYKLKKVGSDMWIINLPLEKGKYRYKFLAGGAWISDPHNKLTENDAFGGKNSLLYVE